MSSTEPKVSCPLVWEFDGHGTWEAISQVMDPDMTDQPVETWCREWCLMWRIHVMEDGTFSTKDSDRLLFRDTKHSIHNLTSSSLSVLQAELDLAEDLIRSLPTFSNGTMIMLLPAETYNNRRRSL